MSRIVLAASFAFLVAASGTAISQEKVAPPIIVRGGGGGLQPVQTFRSLGGGGVGTSPWGYSQSVTYMLHQPQVQKELELVAGQIEELETIQQEYTGKYRELSRSLYAENRRPDALAIAEYQERAAALREETQEKMEKVLLPHQSKRLKQVALQQQLQQRGVANSLTDKQLAELLGLTEDQQQRLKEKLREANERLQQEYAKLREKARDEVLGELTPAQRRKLEEMMGGVYKPQPVDWKKWSQERRERAEQRAGAQQKAAPK